MNNPECGVKGNPNSSDEQPPDKRFKGSKTLHTNFSKTDEKCITITVAKKLKNADYCKAYRQRKKLERQSNNFEKKRKQSNTNLNQNKNAKKCKAYRERKKLQLQSQTKINIQETHRCSNNNQNNSINNYSYTTISQQSAVIPGNINATVNFQSAFAHQSLVAVPQKPTIQDKDFLKEYRQKEAERLRIYRQRKKLASLNIKFRNKSLLEDEQPPDKIFKLHKGSKTSHTNFSETDETYITDIKTGGDSDYDCYEHTEIKEEKWNIENFVKKESTSFLSSQDFEDNYCSQIKIEVKEETSPTTTNTSLEMMFEEDNDQDNSSGTIKTEHPAENLQLPAPSLQTKLPLPLTNCQLPANSVLFLIPTIQGTSSAPILLNLNKLSPVNLSNILPNPSSPPSNLNSKPPEGNRLSPSSRQPLDSKE